MNKKCKVKISNYVNMMTFVVFFLLAIFYLIFFPDKDQSALTKWHGGQFFSLLVCGFFVFFNYRKKDRLEDIKNIEFTDRAIIIHFLKQPSQTFLLNDIKNCEFDANIDKTSMGRFDTKNTHFKMLVRKKDNTLFVKYQEIRPGIFRHSFDCIFELLEIPFSLYGIDVKININGKKDVQYFKGIRKTFLKNPN